MNAYHYGTTRNIVTGGLSLLAAAFFSWRYFGDDGGVRDLIFMIVATVGACFCVYTVIQREPAISWNRKSITLRRWYGTAEVDWDDVHDVSMTTVVLRGQEIHWLSVACEGGFFGSRRVNVPLGFLDIPNGGEAQVVANVRQGWINAVGETGVAMAGAGKFGWGANFYDRGEEPSQFDPDAALARYKSRLNSPEAPAEDTSMARASQPALPVQPAPVANRPVFGRKAV